MSAEDLTHMPVVSLHQDFAVVAALGLQNAERNAHHYFLGLSHLGEEEQRLAAADYPETYCVRNGETFLDIQDGLVQCDRLFSESGLGVGREPNCNSLIPMEAWASTL